MVVYALRDLTGHCYMHFAFVFTLIKTSMIGVLNSLKHVLPTNIKRTIYNSLIVCHLNYGILLWGSQLKIDDKLHKLLKKAVRIITLKGFSAHSEPLFKKLYLLKPCDIYKCQLLKFIYKLVHKQLPHYLNQLPFSLNNTQHNYATRTNKNITIHRVNHEFAKRNIRYKIQTSYNSTPANIIEKISTHSFAELLASHKSSSQVKSQVI